MQRHDQNPVMALLCLFCGLFSANDMFCLTFFVAGEDYNHATEGTGMTVYVDSLFILNFSVNFLILLCTSRLCGTRVRWGVSVLASGIGGAYSVASLFPSMGFLTALPVKAAVGILMSVITFGRERGLIRKTVVFLIVSTAFGGAVFAVSLLDGTAAHPVTFRMVLLSSCLVYAAVSFVLRRTAREPGGGGVTRVSIGLCGRSVRFSALRDTGNSLSDPITGTQVIVTDFETVQELFPHEMRAVFRTENLREPTRILETCVRTLPGAGFRLLPYRAVGTGVGVLLGFKAEETRIGGEKVPPCVVAISPDPVTDGGAYTALCGGIQ